MRPLVQYDLDEPGPALHSPGLPRHPSKKRKRNHFHVPGATSTRKAPLQHWDDPGNAAVGVVYDEQEGGGTTAGLGFETVSRTEGVEEAEEGEEGEYMREVMDSDEVMNAEEETEESRPLTHEEIWDDSALIDAWNSAKAEYEAYHGTSKSWKTEPIKKSPLWYNKPYTAPPPKPQAGPSKQRPRCPNQVHAPHPASHTQEDGDLEPDTAPLDFDTYVPTHDPSLGVLSTPVSNPITAPSVPFFLPPVSTTAVSRDEAFNNALSATYWSGYWTAVYHSQSSEKNGGVAPGAMGQNGIEVDEDEAEAEVEAEEEDLVSTQR